MQKAIDMGNDLQLLRLIKAKLALSVVDAPLFQPQLFISHLEKALKQIWRSSVNELHHVDQLTRSLPIPNLTTISSFDEEVFSNQGFFVVNANIQ